MRDADGTAVPGELPDDEQDVEGTPWIVWKGGRKEADWMFPAVQISARLKAAELPRPDEKETIGEYAARLGTRGDTKALMGVLRLGRSAITKAKRKARASGSAGVAGAKPKRAPVKRAPKRKSRRRAASPAAPQPEPAVPPAGGHVPTVGGVPAGTGMVPATYAGDVRGGTADPLYVVDGISPNVLSAYIRGTGQEGAATAFAATSGYSLGVTFVLDLIGRARQGEPVSAELDRLLAMRGYEPLRLFRP